MHVRDVTVEVRSLALGRIGQIDVNDIGTLTIVKRFNNVGAWTLVIPAEKAMAVELKKPGRGITVEGPYRTLMSGQILGYTEETSAEDYFGTVTFTGVDDIIHLADSLAFPDPTNPDVATQAFSHDIREGKAETVMKGYVDANVGPSAPASRRVNTITIGPDLARGETVYGRARFDVLGELLASLAAPGVGKLGFDLVDVGSSLRFDVYEPSDKSDTVRMDVMNGTLAKSTFVVTNPTATRAIVAGQGEMTERAFVQVTSPESLDAEVEYGRKIERWHDRRDTPEYDELVQTGRETIESGGTKQTSLEVEPSDDQTMIYGLHWYLGDIVGVTVDDQPIVAVVTEAIIRITPTGGVQVGAVVGNPADLDPDAKMATAQTSQGSRIAFLEKNAESTMSTLLNGRLSPRGRKVTNWNEAVDAGFYWSLTSASNNPVGNLAVGQVYPYGPDGTNDRIMQEVWFPSTDTVEMRRSWRRISDDGGSTWTAWVEVAPTATAAEVQAGTDAVKFVTPATLSARTATEDRSGVIELASAAEVLAFTDGTRAITPAALSPIVAAARSAAVGGASDFNAYTTPGFYSASGASVALNAPPGTYGEGILAVFTAGSRITQIFFPYNDSASSMNRMPMTRSYDSTTWGVWMRFVPDATMTNPGIVELATALETIDGLDQTRAVTPAGLEAWDNAKDSGRIAISSYSLLGGTWAIRKIGSMVEIDFSAAGPVPSGSGITEALNALPVQYRPATRNRWGSAYSAGYSITWCVRPDGTAAIANRTGASLSNVQGSIAYFAGE